MADIKPRITIDPKGKGVTVRLRNVRLSFPALWEPVAFDKDDPNAKKNYQATFLLPKKDPDENVKYMRQAIAEVIKMNGKGKHPGDDRVCLQDGAKKADRDIDGYTADIYYISSNNSKPIPVVDRDLTPLQEKNNKPYAGCYVNATVRLWWQDNKYGKRVNAQVRAVQFWADGEPFGSGGADAEEEFERAEADDVL